MGEAGGPQPTLVCLFWAGAGTPLLQLWPSSTPGSKVLGNDLDSSLFPSLPLPTARKEEGPGAVRWHQAPHTLCWLLAGPGGPPHCLWPLVLGHLCLGFPWGRWQDEPPWFPGWHFMAVTRLRNLPG